MQIFSLWRRGHFRLPGACAGCSRIGRSGAGHRPCGAGGAFASFAVICRRFATAAQYIAAAQADFEVGRTCPPSRRPWRKHSCRCSCPTDSAAQAKHRPLWREMRFCGTILWKHRAQEDSLHHCTARTKFALWAKRQKCPVITPFQNTLSLL